jgi:hypothetical protein
VLGKYPHDEVKCVTATILPVALRRGIWRGVATQWKEQRSEENVGRAGWGDGASFVGAGCGSRNNNSNKNWNVNHWDNAARAELHDNAAPDSPYHDESPYHDDKYFDRT